VTAHVAEASEGSGRVLFWLDSGPRSAPGSLDATIRLAAAYGSEIETVEIRALDAAMLDGLPTARICDRRGQSAVIGDDAFSAGLLVRRQRRMVADAAAAFAVPVRHARIDGDTIDGLARLCQEKGPWNIIALSRAPGFDLAALIAGVFANVSGATGVIAGSRRAAPWAARIAVVAEDAERLPSMLRAARRLAGREGSIHLVIAAPTRPAYLELEAQVRLLGSDYGQLVFESAAPTYGVDGALDERLIKARASLVVARFGGTLLSDGRALSRALAVANAPFLLVR
jgi:hypothetical protein